MGDNMFYFNRRLKAVTILKENRDTIDRGREVDAFSALS
jgi:hypothetical protein